MTTQLGRERYEWALLTGALVLVLAGTGWWWTQRSVAFAITREPVAVRFGASAYTSAATPLLESNGRVWSAPPAQSRGAGWRYEMFTPPVIYYHATTKSFVVTPPVMEMKANRPLELELIEVRPQPYRLQLVGYYGAPGDYVAAFSSPDRADTMLVRAGQSIESLGVSLKSIEVAKLPFDDAEGRPTFDWAARALLQDDREGAEVMLDSRSRRFTGKLTAVLRRTADPVGSSFIAAEGDTLLQGNAACRVTHIQLDPARVLIERVTGTAETEQLILVPVSGHVKVADHGHDGVRPLTADATGSIVTADKRQ